MTDTAAATSATASASRPAANADSQDAPSFAQSLAQAGQQVQAQVGPASPKETIQSSGHTADAGTKKQSGAKKENSTDASSNASSDSSNVTAEAISAAQLVLPMPVAAPVTIPTPLPTCNADINLPVASLGSSDPATNVASIAANTFALPVLPPTDAASVSQAPSASGSQSKSGAPSESSSSNNVPSAAAPGAISGQALAALLNSAASAAGAVVGGAATADQHLVGQIKAQLDKALQQGSAKPDGASAQTAVPQGISTVVAPDQKQASMVAASPALPVQVVPIPQPVQAVSVHGAGKTTAMQSQTSTPQAPVQGHAATSSNTDASSQDAQGDGTSKHDRKDNTTDASTSNTLGVPISTATVTSNDVAGFRAAVVTNEVGHVAAPAATASTTTPTSSPAVALQNAAAAVHGPQHDDGVAAASGGTAGSMLPSIQSARLVQTASQSEMRVGLQSQEFGNITIHTAAAGQTVSAQISVEHPELARELAARLPEMQAKSGSNQTIEVRMNSGQQFSAGTGSGGSSAGQEQQGYRQASANSAAFSSNSADGLFHAASANRIFTQPSAATGGRLDIRA